MANIPFIRRYKDYSPGWKDLSTSRGRPGGRRWSYSHWHVVIGLSVLLNLVFLWRWWFAPQTPLDNYQNLNMHPLVDARVEPIPAHENENAIVTSLYTDAFAPAVATLGHTLNSINSTARRIMIYLPDKVSRRAVCIASVSGFVPHPVARIPPPHSGVHRHFLDQYSKLQLWTLDSIGVKSLVYVDADMLAYHNFDELFSLPYSFGAVPDVYLDGRGYSVGFNAGMLFLRPSTEVFQDMVSKIATARYPAEDAEQSFLNHYYGKEAVRLPYAYNANLAIKKRSPELWADLRKEARLVHYTLVKPFLQGDYAEVPLEMMHKNAQSKMRVHGGVLREEVAEWEESWSETEAMYGDGFATCHLSS